MAPALALPWLLGEGVEESGTRWTRRCRVPPAQQLAGTGESHAFPPPHHALWAVPGQKVPRKSVWDSHLLGVQLGPLGQVALVAPPAFPLCAHARGTLVNRWCRYEPHNLPHLPVNTYVNSAKKLEERFSRCWRTAV